MDLTDQLRVERENNKVLREWVEFLREQGQRDQGELDGFWREVPVEVKPVEMSIEEEIRHNLTDVYYPRFQTVLLKHELPTQIFKKWLRLPPFEYNDTKSECLDCKFSELYQIDTKKFYLGQRNKNDQMSGRGALITVSAHGKAYLYEGYWKDGTQTGRGRVLWDDMESYEGFFLKNKRHGKGVYKALRGVKRTGTWKKDQLHGDGTYEYGDARRYVGPYVNDQKHGKFKIVLVDDPDVVVAEEKYHYGNLIK